MPPPSSPSSVLLLDRAPLDTTPTPGDGPVERPRSATPPAALFRAPGLALLAAVSVLEGYRWFGIIANTGSRPWAVAFALLAVPAAVALTRPLGTRQTTMMPGLVRTAALGAAVATVVVLWTDQPWATATLGTTDLGLASAALALLVAAERSRHRTG